MPAAILDASTSSLDPRSKADVIATLRSKYGPATPLIMIMHHPNLVERADQVLFMQVGELAGIGRHGELCAGLPITIVCERLLVSTLRSSPRGCGTSARSI